MPRRLKVKTLLTVIVAGSMGVLTGFSAALFFQALGKMTADEDAGHSYLTFDPWDVMPDDYDKFKDDNLTN
jgi:hypothetical protein